MPTLQLQKDQLADASRQIEILEDERSSLPFFLDHLAQIGLAPLRPLQIDTFQINLGKLCNQTCNHCHVDAGPDRKEIMTRETMEDALAALDRSDVRIVDITGGAPEMNPHFQWFVEQISARKLHIIVRCNLTIIMASKRFSGLPEFYRQHAVEVISSLPYFEKGRTDRQRGDGVFERSIEALQRLNGVGYGKQEQLQLNLVYNPAGAFLPADQVSLEQDFKRILQQKYNIIFNNLYTITNLPISRFLKYLLASGNYEEYMQRLVNAFNPAAAENVMCRNMISIGWDGYLYDCDFNQMLSMNISQKDISQKDTSQEDTLQEDIPQGDGSAEYPSHPFAEKGQNGRSGAFALHLRDFNQQAFTQRMIHTGRHCFGCTAGAGSSCGGATA